MLPSWVPLSNSFDPWIGKIPWRKAWQPLQHSCLESHMDRGAWRAMVHRVTQSRTRLKQPGVHAKPQLISSNTSVSSTLSLYPFLNHFLFWLKHTGMKRRKRVYFWVLMCLDASWIFRFMSFLELGSFNYYFFSPPFRVFLYVVYVYC